MRRHGHPSSGAPHPRLTMPQAAGSKRRCLIVSLPHGRHPRKDHPLQARRDCPRQGGTPAARPRRACAQCRPRAPLRRRDRGQAPRRQAGTDRRGQEGEPLEGPHPRRLRSAGARQGLRGRRGCLLVRPDRRPLVPGRARVPDGRACGDRAAGAAQGLHDRHLPGRRGARVGRRLHLDHPRRGRR